MRKYLSWGGLALMLCLVAGAAGAGQPPRDVAVNTAVVEAPDATTDLARLPPGIRIERDIKYGPDERNLLDVVTDGPVSGPARPVLLFVHGGAFVEGHKQMPGKPYYDNVMLAAVADGFVGVNMTYRLAPGAPWPAGAEDVGAAVRWVAGNIAARGGDPARIYLMGHSSGAVHVATYLAHREFQDPDGDLLAGAILVSGFYDLTSMELTDQRRAYFGTDTSTYKERSSLEGLIASRTPLLVLRAETEPEVFSQQFDELRTALCASPRGCVKTGVLPNHRHANAVQSIDGRGSALFKQLVAFVYGEKNSPEPVGKNERVAP